MALSGVCFPLASRRNRETLLPALLPALIHRSLTLVIHRFTPPVEDLHVVLPCTFMPAWLLVLLTIGAIARLARLLTADKISEPIREWVDRRWGDDSARSYFVTCDYCVSMYVAPVVATVAVLWGDNRVVVIGLIALTASLVAGTLAAHE